MVLLVNGYNQNTVLDKVHGKGTSTQCLYFITISAVERFCQQQGAAYTFNAGVLASYNPLRIYFRLLTVQELFLFHITLKPKKIPNILKRSVMRNGLTTIK